LKINALSWLIVVFLTALTTSAPYSSSSVWYGRRVDSVGLLPSLNWSQSGMRPLSKLLMLYAAKPIKSS